MVWTISPLLRPKSIKHEEIFFINVPLSGEWPPRELWPLVTEFLQLIRGSSCCKKNFVLECCNRYVNHITKSYIFKNLIWNKTFAATLAASCRKYFRCLKLYSKLISQELVLYIYLLKIQGFKFTFYFYVLA